MIFVGKITNFTLNFCKRRSFLDILGVQLPSKITKNNSGNYFRNNFVSEGTVKHSILHQISPSENILLQTKTHNTRNSSKALRLSFPEIKGALKHRCSKLGAVPVRAYPNAWKAPCQCA